MLNNEGQLLGREEKSVSFFHQTQNPSTMNHQNSSDKNRRNFLKTAAAGGLVMGAFLTASAEESIEFATQKVSPGIPRPSDLKITDMRFAVVKDAPMRCPLIRIDTNQDIYGLGEVRDGATWRYALFLKSRLLGKNPCSVEMLFKFIKQFGFHGRQGGGVSGVEMALWDLAGKAYDVPVYQMLGGKYRDSGSTLFRYSTVSRPGGICPAHEGASGQGIHLPENGLRN